MSLQRLFNLLIAAALLVAVVLTVREAAATSAVISDAASVSAAKSECNDLPSRHSIHSKYVSERGVWVSYTEDGATGPDGGLVHLLSDCSR